MFSLFAHESLAYSEFVSFGGSLTPDRLLSSVFLLCHRVKVDLQFFNSCAYAQSDHWQETPTTSTVMPTSIIRHFQKGFLPWPLEAYGHSQNMFLGLISTKCTRVCESILWFILSSAKGPFSFEIGP